VDEALAKGSSVVHRLDPRLKVLEAAAFSGVVALADAFPVLFLALPLPVVLTLWARLNLRAVLRRLLAVNAFVLLLWFFLPLGFQGEALGSIGGLEVSREGVLWAAKITLKANAIVLASIALLSTTPLHSLVHALHHLRLPDKLVHLLFFCFRYVHVIEEEYRRAVTAMKVRGFEPRTDLHTYRSYAYLVGTLLVKSSDRSRRVYQAMLCRGFEGKYWVLDHFTFKPYDGLIFAAMAAWTLCLGVLQWGIL